jgi:hypothetical protein
MDNNILTQLEDDLLDDIIIQTTIQHLQSRRRVPRPMRTGLPGGVYIQELLDSDNQERIKQVLRMTKPTFFALRDWLVNHTELRKGDMTVEEKLAIFLHITSRPASNRDTQERFSHSGETVSR